MLLNFENCYTMKITAQPGKENYYTTRLIPVMSKNCVVIFAQRPGRRTHQSPTPRVAGSVQLHRPLPSECGTYKTVQARFWPWLSAKSPENMLSCPPFAWSDPGSSLIRYNLGNDTYYTARLILVMFKRSCSNSHSPVSIRLTTSPDEVRPRS